MFVFSGFDDKISKNKDLADDAISKLPAIKATIQDAVDTNAKTTSVLDSVDKPYNGALATVSTLEDIVTRLEVRETGWDMWMLTRSSSYANMQLVPRRERSTLQATIESVSEVSRALEQCLISHITFPYGGCTYSNEN